MPNHVHVLFQINPNFELEQLIHSWKLKTASDINRKEKLSGNLWQKDYFDRMIRDQNHFANCVRYIRNNPRKARLRKGEYLLFESDLAKEID